MANYFKPEEVLDPDGLAGALRELVGRKVLWSTSDRTSAAVLDFSPRVRRERSVRNDKLTQEQRDYIGTWSLFATCAWQVDPADRAVGPAEIERAGGDEEWAVLELLVGATVLAASTHASTMELELEFEGGMTLCIDPTGASPDDSAYFVNNRSTYWSVWPDGRVTREDDDGLDPIDLDDPLDPEGLMPAFNTLVGREVLWVNKRPRGLIVEFSPTVPRPPSVLGFADHVPQEQRISMGECSVRLACDWHFDGGGRTPGAAELAQAFGEADYAPPQLLVGATLSSVAIEPTTMIVQLAFDGGMSLRIDPADVPPNYRAYNLNLPAATWFVDGGGQVSRSGTPLRVV